jgi:hypothetical protein
MRVTLSPEPAYSFIAGGSGAFMPDRDDRTYFLSRARHERGVGSTCEDNAVALAHLKMADEYERRAAGRRPVTHIDAPARPS